MREKDKGMLLVQLPPWDFRTPPLGLAYLYSFLRSKGVKAELLDLNIEMYNRTSDMDKKGWGNEDYHWWQSSRLDDKFEPLFSAFAERILSFNKRVIGFSATAPSINFLNRILKLVRVKDKVIIVGGPATYFKELRNIFWKDAIDYFVVGDGEFALYALLNRIEGRNDPESLKGRNFRQWRDNWRDKARCVQTDKIMDLDSLPAPGFDGYRLSSYTEGSFTLPVIFSKGCTRACTFCSDTVISRPYRIRKASSVLDEISRHMKSFPGVNTFRLNDLSFNANIDFIEEFCERIMASGLKFQWYGQAQVRPDMTKELLVKMKAAGCRQFDLGLENFSDHVLKMMGKGYTSAEAQEFLKKAWEAGIENNVLFIVGYPGETEEDFEVNKEAIARNSRYIFRVGSLNICGMPIGSELRNNPAKHGYLFPPGGDWQTLDGVNNYEVRKRRYKEMIKHCLGLGIKVECCLDLELFEESK